MTDYQIWPATSGPGASSADSSVNLATEFSVSTTAWLKAIRFWRADTNITGTVLGRVWQAINGSSGTAVSGTDVTFTLSGTGWQQANLVTPVQLTAGVKYKAACLFPSGYSATGNYWTSGGGAGGITTGILTAPDKAGSVGGDTQGCFAYGASLAYPANGSGNGGCYWVDILVTDVDPTGSAVVGTGLASLGALSGTASGVRNRPGSAIIVFGGLSATASGVRTVIGAASVSIGGLAGTAQGTRTVVAVATATLGGLTGTASGTRTVLGSVNATLGVLAASIVGNVSLRGTGYGLLGLLLATATVAAPPPVVPTGNWMTLLDIVREGQAWAAAEASRPPEACPNDGEPLERGRNGILHCRFDRWTSY